jgi:hypothetical protein
MVFYKFIYKSMKWINTFESYIDNELISKAAFVKVPIGSKTIFKPSFGAKKGETDFYQLVIDGKPEVEIEINPNSITGKPEIMSAFSNIISKGLGEYLVKKVLDIYFIDEVFVRVTKYSKKFWQRCGATVVNPSDPYLLHFVK